MTIVLGVTGSIGMGKSTVAKVIAREYGAPLHDADAVVRKLLTQDGPAKALIAQTFPESYNRKTKQIDRAKLGAIVFEDAEKKQALEDILHPLVRQAQQEMLQQNMRAKYAILDIPLLFETGGDLNCDYTICVSAPFHIQRQRVLARGMSEQDFQARRATQMADVEKQALADFVIQTGLSHYDTLKQIRNMMRKIGGPDSSGIQNNAEVRK